jgi:hypothetical protein
VQSEANLKIRIYTEIKTDSAYDSADLALPVVGEALGDVSPFVGPSEGEVEPVLGDVHHCRHQVVTVELQVDLEISTSGKEGD